MLLNFYPKLVLALMLVASACSASSFDIQCKEKEESLRVSLLIFDMEQRNAFEEIASNFSIHCPFTNISYVSINDAQYKQRSMEWLTEGNNIDVMLWLWSADLKSLANKGLVEPLTALWQEPQMQSHAPVLKKLATIDKEQFAVPFSQGFWGLYTNATLLQDHGIYKLENWDELISACKVLSQNNVTPIAIGTKDKWSILAWFDYLVLRIHGLVFYERVIRGEIPFTDDRMLVIFKKWKELIDNRCFLHRAENFTFKQVLPLFYRNKAALVLSGNFLVSQIPDEVVADIDFISFPIINSDTPKYELSPVDFFIIPSNSSNKELAKTFLRYLSTAEVQSKINNKIHFMPVNPKAKLNGNKFLYAGIKNITSSSGLTQYFDRTATKNYYLPIMDELVIFLKEGDVDKTVNQLELIRQTTFELK